MSTEPTQIYEMSPGEAVTVRLPHGIGHVEIRTSGVNGPTGYPAIGVSVYSKTEHSPAADGRLYKAIRVFRDDEIVLVGKPGPKMLEEERFAKRVAAAIAAHDRGDHTACNRNCLATKEI